MNQIPEKSDIHVRSLALVQASYYLIGGLWPLIHMPSFEALTGPKNDDWLVRSVAGILVVVGVGLIIDVWKNWISFGMMRTAGGISLVLSLVALISSMAGWISWVYFFDGVGHATFFLGWVWIALRNKSTKFN